MSVNHTPSAIEPVVYQVFNRLPDLVADHARALAFRAFGAPVAHQQAQLPRKPMMMGPGNTVVQVGTPNVYRVHQLRDYVGETGEVLIIEPIPENAEALRTAAAEYENVTIDERAAGEIPRTVEQSVVMSGGGQPQMAPDVEAPDTEDTTHQTVEYERLDRIVSDYDLSPDYLEVMVNGAEHDVLAGAGDVLATAEPRVLVKSFGYNLASESSPTDIESLLTEAGYRTVRAPARSTPPSRGSPDGDIFAWT